MQHEMIMHEKGIGWLRMNQKGRYAHPNNQTVPKLGLETYQTSLPTLSKPL